LTIILSSITGGVYHTVSGQTITWIFQAFPGEVSFSVTVNPGQLMGTRFVNVAECVEADGNTQFTNQTYHELDGGGSVTEQYYLYDNLTNSIMLAADNDRNGGFPTNVAVGASYNFVPAHAPAMFHSYYYYGYQYIQDTADDPGAPQGSIHTGPPPATLFTNVQSSKIIRYYYGTATDTGNEPYTVTVHFVDTNGVALGSPVMLKIDEVATGGTYYMPARYLESFLILTDTWNYYGYELTNTVNTAKTRGAQPDMSILYAPNAPQFTNVQANKDITLYFCTDPLVTVHFVEDDNAFNILHDEEKYFVTGGTFDPDSVNRTDSPSTPRVLYYPIDLITGTDESTHLPISRTYDYRLKWDLNNGALQENYPPVLDNIDSNLDLTLYFGTKYKIVQKYHPLNAPYIDLDTTPDVLKAGGESWTAKPPVRIDYSGEYWYYVGYRMGNDDVAITYAYPPDPTLASVTEDYLITYVYRKHTAADDPTTDKTAEVCRCGTSHAIGQPHVWEAPAIGSDAAPVRVEENETVRYTINVTVPTTAIPAPVVFNYNTVTGGAVQEFIAPCEGDYLLETWGAQGGGTYGAKGGYSKGTVHLAAGETVYVYVGGQGASGSGTLVAGQVKIAAGGFNGGGEAYYSATSATYNAAVNGGGGATDIRIGTDSLYARAIVAGGGGGGASTSTYSLGVGGGVSGINSNATDATNYVRGMGGTQTAGGVPSGTGNASYMAAPPEPGSFGFGGAGAKSPVATNSAGGGGGGGWYGGSGGGMYSSTTNRGGGGGSGFIYTASSTVPAAGWLLNSAYYLSGAQTLAGNVSVPNPESTTPTTGRAGNGLARITLTTITITDLLPEGLSYVSSDRGGVSSKSGARDEVTWKIPLSDLNAQNKVTVTVIATVKDVPRVYINTADVVLEGDHTMTNLTYHKSPEYFKITERYYDKDNIDVPIGKLANDRETVVAYGDTFLANPDTITDWVYYGWYLGTDSTNIYFDRLLIDPVLGPDTITHLYTRAASAGYTLHIRQIVLNPITDMPTPPMGYYNLSNGGTGYPATSLSGTNPAITSTPYTAYAVTLSSTDKIYKVLDNVPQYYEYAGYKRDNAEFVDNTGMVLPAVTANGDIELDYDRNNDWWLTVYITPKATDDDHDESWGTNIITEGNDLPLPPFDQLPWLPPRFE
jgi:hypothetical protein